MEIMNHKLIASGANEEVQIFLDRWNYNTYTVSIHYSDDRETTHEDFDSIAWSCHRFFNACNEFGVTPVKNF